MSTPSTVVHFVGGTAPGHVAERIYVNGQEVRVAEDGASITYGPAQTTTVTLDLQASEVTFTSTPPDDEVLGDLAESMAERNRQLQDENHALRQSEAEAQFALEDAKTEVERLTELSKKLQDEARYAREDTEARQDDDEASHDAGEPLLQATALLHRVERAEYEVTRLHASLDDEEANADRLKAEVQRLTRERDEWMQRYETSHANRLHAERAYEATRTDADGNALVTVRAGDVLAALENILVEGPYSTRLRRALDEREGRS